MSSLVRGSADERVLRPVFIFEYFWGEWL